MIRLEPSPMNEPAPNGRPGTADRSRVNRLIPHGLLPLCLAAAASCSSPMTVHNAVSNTGGSTPAAQPPPAGAGPASPQDLVDALHSAFGDHHVRAVHAKGVILMGTFVPDASASSLTRAAHLQSTPSKTTVRFSDFTGIPDIPDNAGAANPRGLAIRFTLPDGTETDIVAHSFDGFPTKTADQFRQLLLAIAASGSDAAKPTALDKFLAEHETARVFLSTQKTPASYASIGYFGANAFKMTNQAGNSHFVRYQVIPEDGEHVLTKEQADAAGPSYLADGIRTRIAKGPISFTLYAQLAEPGDAIEDPSIAWPASRHRVRLGELTITALAPNTVAEDKALVFSPSRLPDGIESADPMIDFRSRAYPISHQHRQ
jgi:catalase